MTSFGHIARLLGRKFNVSSFFLGPSWYKCPKTMRLNTQYAFIYQLPTARELRDIGSNITKEDFKRAYREATKDKYNSLLMDKKSNNPMLQYRNGIDRMFDWIAEE